MSSAAGGTLEDRWQAHWQGALEAWSRFTKLSPPRWCLSAEDEAEEGLTSSFAMIRLDDHAVVISLRQVREQGLEGFATEVLAHEIGHHVYAPGDLRDNARLLARTRAGLPGHEGWAGMVANLYTDLLINDRLQRSAGLDMLGVYKKLRQPGDASSLWTLYMRIYERLWALPSDTLIPKVTDARLESDADLGSRLVRAYAQEWLHGAGRFACLCLPYVQEMGSSPGKAFAIPWLDAQSAGAGEAIPDGLAEVEEGEEEGAMHPAMDPELSGVAMGEAGDDMPEHPGQGGPAATRGGHKQRYRDPVEYLEIMKSLGVRVDPKDLVIRYYRERAIPYIIPFPMRELSHATDPLPEAMEIWEAGSPLNAVDWVESVARSPVVIPGVTTVQRTWGTTQGGDPERVPVDLYLGVDCSGSMNNPAHKTSYPVLAGAVILLSALRVGAKVMTCLSGEPGQFTETDGFLRSEREVMGVLTGYLGTGYAYGIRRLEKTFIDGPELKRPAHILIVSDQDIFYMLKQVAGGWDIAQQALERAGGGGTMVLELSYKGYEDDVKRLEAQGWAIHRVVGPADMLPFAKAFARTRYAER